MKVGPNVTHRADGRWEARYIKGHSAEGKAIYGFCYGKTEDEAVHKADDAKRLLKNSVIEEPKRFRDIYAMWSNSDSALDAERFADKYLLPEIGDTAITQLTDRELSKLIQSIKTKSSPADTKKCFELIRNVFNYAVNEDYLLASPLGTETMKYQSGRKAPVTKGILTITEREYLSNEQAKRLEELLLEGLESKKLGVSIGLYLCLHLGLTRQEVGALQFGDIDFQNKTLRVNKVTSKALKHADDKYSFEITPIEERLIPLPRFVCEFLEKIRSHYTSPASFLAYNKSGAQCQTSKYVRELDKLNEIYQIAPKLNLKMLRETFIVRCIKNSIDMPTIMKLLGSGSVSDFWTRYGGLYATHTADICKLDTYETGTRQDRGEPEKMNLLILGAGGYGHTVKEIAEKIGVFDQIAFLDDNPAVADAIDTCANAPRYRSTFPCAYPAIGDCKRRAELIAFLEKEDFQVPRLIHPSATLSPSSVIDSGVIIEANATVNAMARIMKGCILSSNALIDRGAVVSEAVHVDSSSTVAKDVVVPPMIKITSGTVYTGEKE